ncbi:MAG: family 78 glycoside hydrolase catalytic domain [Planctomycetes bacterium]|nr:family 78 glycoside hydrolase catalytic domain [Planctomycetota bacterium]
MNTDALTLQAAWIAMPDGPRGRAAPLLRRAFSLAADVAAARLRICGLGYCEAFLNGRRVGDHVLDPAQTDYDRRCLVVSYDVAPLLRRGDNVLGAMLGDGWFNQTLVWGGLSYGSPRLLAELDITLADGSRVLVATDAAWRCAAGPVTAANVYAGEHYDARLEQRGWDAPGFDDAAWLPVQSVPGPGGRLEPQTLPPIRRIQDLRPAAITEPRPGCFVVDLGQNLAGWLRIRTEAPAGTTIRLRFAETTGPDGMIDTASTGVKHTGVEQEDVYTCRGGGAETWEPRLTYHGFRYAEIRGWPGAPTADDVTGVAVHTDLPAAGAFACSDERLNRLHRMALWTLRSNIHGLPTDCPARERCGWLGDAHIVCEYAILNYRSRTFWQKYLDDIDTTRAGNSGLPCNVAPGKRACGTARPDWMAAAVLIPWYLWLYYGDDDAMRRHWDAIETVLAHFDRLADGGILAGGYGDWFDPGVSAYPRFTPEELTTTVWYYRCTDVAARMAAHLGRGSAAERHAAQAERIARAFVARFYDAEHHTFGSQTADAMALQFGLVPPGAAAAVAASLAADVRRHDTHLTVGIMGLRVLFDALTRHGYGQLALALMHQDTYPGLGHLIARGATTLWEYWGEAEVDDRHGPRSLNHPMMGGYDNWFYTTLAGIRPDPDAPGFRHTLLQPHPIAGLDWVSAYHDSPHGRIASAWRMDADRFRWTVALPAGTAATAILPFSGRRRELAGGGETLLEEPRPSP